MRKSDFITKSLVIFMLAVLLNITALDHFVFAASENIYGGAIGFYKDTIEAIEKGQVDENVVYDENVIEEPEAIKDLSGNILNGISIGNIDLSGDSYNQAVEEVNDYVNTISNSSIVLNSVNGNTVEVTAAQLGISWNDKSVIEEALSLGKEGNIVERYKAKKDLEHEQKVYPLDLSFDQEKITEIVMLQGNLYNVEGVNASISKADGDFTITPGVIGQKIDVNRSVETILSKLANYKGENETIDLVVVEDEPKGKTEDLEKIRDVIGSYKTSFSSSSSDRSGNVRNGTNLIDGTVLYPGDMFSMYDTVSPFTEENGYFLAGSYSNGMVVESFGGGICQVSSTLYNAVLRAELEVNERFNHSMIVSYVDLSSDAAISGTSKDFKFTNNKDYPIYIEAYTTSDKQVVFNIYGVEDRPSNRQVKFESVKISETVPDTEKVVADSSKPLGSVSVQSAHVGYVGELWKIVTVDGVEVERTQVNKSTYNPSPKTATVGTATDNPTALAIVQQAIATNNIDYVKSVISNLNAAAAASVAPQI